MHTGRKVKSRRRGDDVYADTRHHGLTAAQAGRTRRIPEMMSRQNESPLPPSNGHGGHAWASSKADAPAPIQEIAC